MEPEETGLTVAEKVMFWILGLALLVVGGLLIFGNIKKNNAKLENNTEVTERANDAEVKKETVSDDSATTKEEPTPEIKKGEKSESEEKESSSSEKSDDKSDATSKEEIKSDKESDTPKGDTENSTRKTNDDETPITRVPDTRVDDESANDSWDIPKNIILEAYTGDTVEVNKTVVTSDGRTESAQVTVRKLEGNSYNIIELTNNRFVASKGTYKYYYTHNSITKIATLHVDEKATNVSFSTLPSFDYVEQDEFTRFEFTNLVENSKGTTITIENDVYVININKENDTNYSALLINTGEKLNSIKSNTKGIYIGSDYSTLWNENYESGTARVIVNLNYIKSNEVIRLRVNINGETKIVEVKFIIHNNVEKREKLESDLNNAQNNEIQGEEVNSDEKQSQGNENSSGNEELPGSSENNNIDKQVESNDDLNQSLDRT
jgi:hypothetical protein